MKFKVNDYGRLSKFKTDLFVVSLGTGIRRFFRIRVFPTNPPTYHLKDSSNELIEGRFYEQELMKISSPTHT